MIFKMFRKKEYIAIGGQIITSYAMRFVRSIQQVQKCPDGNCYYFEVPGATQYTCKSRLKREAVAEREKLIEFWERWR